MANGKEIDVDKLKKEQETLTAEVTSLSGEIKEENASYQAMQKEVQAKSNQVKEFEKLKGLE